MVVGGVLNSGVLADPAPGARFDYVAAPARGARARACVRPRSARRTTCRCRPPHSSSPWRTRPSSRCSLACARWTSSAPTSTTSTASCRHELWDDLVAAGILPDDCAPADWSAVPQHERPGEHPPRAGVPSCLVHTHARCPSPRPRRRARAPEPTEASRWPPAEDRAVIRVESALRNDGRRPSLTDKAYEHVRDGILHGDIPVGTVLAEATIADELGISKTADAAGAPAPPDRGTARGRAAPATRRARVLGRVTATRSCASGRRSRRSRSRPHAA